MDAAQKDQIVGKKLTPDAYGGRIFLVRAGPPAIRQGNGNLNRSSTRGAPPVNHQFARRGQAHRFEVRGNAPALTDEW